MTQSDSEKNLLLLFFLFIIESMEKRIIHVGKDYLILLLYLDDHNATALNPLVKNYFDCFCISGLSISINKHVLNFLESYSKTIIY